MKDATNIFRLVKLYLDGQTYKYWLGLLDKMRFVFLTYAFTVSYHIQFSYTFNTFFFCFVLTVLQNIEVKSCVKHIKENLYHQFIKQNVFVNTKAPINSQFQRWPSRITRTYFFDNSRKILSQNVFLQYESSDIYII